MADVNKSESHNSLPSKDPYNRGGFLAFVFSMVFSLAFFVYVAVLHPGVNLREVPEEGTEAEQVLADADQASEPQFDPTTVSEPWLTSAELVAHGKAVYKQNCAVCHGNEGNGDGPAGGGLVPPPRNLVEGGWKQGGTRIALYTTLLKGIEGSSMVSFAGLPAVDRWAMVHFIRDITKDRPADTDEEVAKYAQSAK